MKMESRSLVLTILERIFITKNTQKLFFVVLDYLLEALAYLFVVFASEEQFEGEKFGVKAMLGLMLFFAVLLVLRIATGVILIKMFYPIILSVLVDQIWMGRIGITIAPLLLLTLLLIIDILSNVRMDFGRDRMTGQTINLTKIMHPTVLISGLVLAIVYPGRYQHILAGTSFLLLTIFKAASMMVSSTLKEIQMRIYLLLSSVHFVLILQSFVALPLPSQYVTPIILSLVLYKLLLIKKKPIKLDELYSQQNYFKLSFKICANITSQSYDKKFNKAIQNFVGDDFHQGLTQREKKKMILDKLDSVLARKKTFQTEILRANIYILDSNQILKAKKIVQTLRDKTGYNLFKKILVFRLQELMLDCFAEKHHKVHFNHYQNYFKCDHFRNLLLKSSIHAIHYWQYTLKHDIIPEKVRDMANKTIDFQDQIKKEYQEIDPKCMSVTITYAGYLFDVQRNTKESKRLLQKLSFNQAFQINFHIHQKIFLRMDLEDDPLKILKIGRNVSMLLGFDRKELEGQKHEILIPQFYRKYHKEAATDKIQSHMDNMYLFKKKTIIKNKNNIYQECDVILRVTYGLGEIMRLEGFLHIRENKQFNWQDYLIANQENGQIVQCGPTLEEFAPTQSILHTIGQIYDSQNVFMARVALEDNGYHQLLMLREQDKKFHFYVRKNSQYELCIHDTSLNKMQPFLGVLEPPKFGAIFSVNFKQIIKDIFPNIFAKQYILLFILSILLLSSIIVARVCQTNIIHNRFTAKAQVMNQTSDLLYFYTNTTNLEIGINYLDMKNQANYQNNYVSINLVDRSLELHFLNQRLRQYGVATYNVPSKISGITYTQTQFELIMEFLSNAYLIQKFSSDTFLTSLIYQRQRFIMNTLNTQVLSQYRDQYLLALNGEASSSKMKIILTTIGIGIASLLLYAIIVRSEHKTRVNENEVLNVVCNVECQNDFIDKAKGFISKVTKEEVPASFKQESLAVDTKSKMRRQETSFAPDYTATERQYTKSQMSMRQLSGRNLMDSSMNKSYAESRFKNKDKQVHYSFKKIKIAHRRKKWLILPLILIAASILLQSVNLVKYEIMDNINQNLSGQHIIAQFQQSYQFSKSVNNFLNYINLKLSGQSVNSTAFLSAPDTVLAMQAYIDFQEKGFEQFQAFQSSLLQLEYNYMCTYNNCEARFFNQINIIYLATIQKVMRLMNSLMASWDSLNITQFTAEMSTSTTVKNIDLAYYTELLIRSNLQKLFSDFFHAHAHLEKYQMMSRGVILGITNLIILTSIVLFIILTVMIYRNQRYLSRIVNIFRVSEEEEAPNSKEDKIKQLDKENQMPQEMTIMVNSTN